MATVPRRTQRPSSGTDEQLSSAQAADTVGDQQKHSHPLDVFVPDPTGMTPLCDEGEFAALIENMVADEAPRLFAVVQEYGQRVDGVIAAWGIAFEDHAEVVSADGRLYLRLQAPQHAVRRFHVGTHIRAHLVWFNPNAATPADDHEAT